jgi:Tat protein secretion system quality control protein TatD with DNase activity
MSDVINRRQILPVNLCSAPTGLISSVDILSSEYSKGLCSYLPLPKILPETDNPEGYPWLYGRKGFPADIIGIYEAIASIKGLSLARLKERMKENLLEVMKDMP